MLSLGEAITAQHEGVPRCDIQPQKCQVGTSVPKADVAAGCGCAQVLDRFLFERAAELGMETGGAEDGSHLCLLFDTIQTVVSTHLP